MKIEFDIDLETLDETPAKDGQISVKVTKEQEMRFKTLNTRHSKKLSAFMREFAFRLMDKIESRDKAS